MNTPPLSAEERSELIARARRAGAAALGLPLVCAPPVGVHERRNRRWVREAGAGVKQRDPAHAAEWLLGLVDEGELAAAAWAGYVRLPPTKDPDEVPVEWLRSEMRRCLGR